MTTKPADLRPWLGPAWDELNTDQLDRLCAESDRITERHPDADDAHLRDAALSAAVQYVLGEVNVDDAGRDLAAAYRQLELARAASRQLAVMLYADTDNEQGAARRTGINRMTLRGDLGKQ